jgi:hypothetical protein
MRFALAADPAVQKVAAAATSAATGAASWWTADWSVAVFGVPLSVLLAAFAGAVVALTFLPPVLSFLQLVGRVVMGTVASAYVTPLAGFLWAGIPHLPVAFLLGLAALAAIAKVPVFLDDLRTIARNRWGGGGGPVG